MIPDLLKEKLLLLLLIKKIFQEVLIDEIYIYIFLNENTMSDDQNWGNNLYKESVLYTLEFKLIG